MSDKYNCKGYSTKTRIVTPFQIIGYARGVGLQRLFY